MMPENPGAGKNAKQVKIQKEHEGKRRIRAEAWRIEGNAGSSGMNPQVPPRPYLTPFSRL